MSDTEVLQSHQQARSATNTYSDTITATKKQPGSTGMHHNLRIPGCKLNRIQAQCSGDTEGTRIVVVKTQTSADDSACTYDQDDDYDITTVLGVVPHGKPNTTPVVIQFDSELFDVSVEYSYEYTTGYEKTGDKVTLTYAGSSPCVKHPLWKITEQSVVKWTEPGTPIKYEFLPPVPDQDQLPRRIMAWWLKDVPPRVYQVTCKSCKGSDDLPAIEIHVYPNVESSTTLKFGPAKPSDDKGPTRSKNPLTKLAKMLLKSVVRLAKDVLTGKKSKLDPPSGEIKLANKWEEDDESSNARWSGSVSIGLDPVIGFEIRESVVPIEIIRRVVPDRFLKYVNADVYVDLTGDITWSLSYDWYMYPDRAIHVQCDVKEALGGDLGLEVGIEAWVGKAEKVDDSVLYCTLHGNSSIGVEGSEKVTDDLELEIEVEFKFSGLSVTGEIVFQYGTLHKFKYHKKGTWQVMKERKHKFGPYKFSFDEDENQDEDDDSSDDDAE